MAKKPQSKALTNWREEAAASAAKAATMEQSSGGGKFFSMRAGVLSYDDVALPGNQMCAVILEGMYENVYYAEKFDPEAKTPPTCFAFGYDNDEMQPHDSMDEHPDVFEKQSEFCKDCPQNEWGSADRGKGKACGNRRRLAVIPGGQFSKKGDLEIIDDEKIFAKADLAYMKLPVTSVKAYSSYVREVSEQLGKPLWAVFTRIYLEPDAKSQFKVAFELIDEIPEELMDTVFKRHGDAEKDIAFPYQPRNDDEEEQKPVKNNVRQKLAGKAPAKGRQPAKPAPRKAAPRRGGR